MCPAPPHQPGHWSHKGSFLRQVFTLSACTFLLSLPIYQMQRGSLSFASSFRFWLVRLGEQHGREANALVRGDPVARHRFKRARRAERLEPTPAIAAYTLHECVGFPAIPRLIPPPVGEDHLQAVSRAASLLQPIRAGKVRLSFHYTPDPCSPCHQPSSMGTSYSRQGRCQDSSPIPAQLGSLTSAAPLFASLLLPRVPSCRHNPHYGELSSGSLYHSITKCRSLLDGIQDLLELISLPRVVHRFCHQVKLQYVVLALSSRYS